MKLKKAIIPAAGLGTRFLPATKAQPKEMLPIVDKPTIQYIIEEAVESGIEDILIVTGRGKRAIEDHFDRAIELEETLEKKEKRKELSEIRQICKLAHIHYVRQGEPKGLGHAIWCARKFIGDEPFAVLLGDDIVQSEKPCLKQLIGIYDKYEQPIVGVQQVPEQHISKYGIVAPSGMALEPNVMRVSHFVEKPLREHAPSSFAIMGRYILTPDIFNILEQQQPTTGGEIQLTDAISTLNYEQAVLAFNFQGIRYDVGDKFGFIKATVDFALQRDDLRADVLHYLQELYERELVGSGR
ncbi:UTP--glucose-1-phosphate uridylyltransferase GalU [Paenibacillus apiarius]|uniref:UTP--glucose-1-phosphate uridylyltransferase n=1 Tax=Paenibacillus apiarius TaxID=46240 RepID=A0ABT4DUU7_9BACL|nr:UTP--glucose-1-phosphate uridylyltransferase GalU [Paenibacillus apiarius]MCY9516417.1 UTP--glucose-1-phosphate uridylyltransferase GalU [Paenibacillus apiarius]MCY9521123.1 UTP--glucose-1-phosphate uridylyltransferase GalU [Paenibacillus apiarius]MCY9551970.1 UTP--glucose-1-phosphate uridylyltransferase GalU [Paenibacillus apiarius]MCY9560915.1 UTP--glucose-1-phosphate uridylyltransferase GalU [Paenibacillus apiarius]MCY9684544.1 UTP--glucose-1-phosphate uridylyltransferase GalU [Paenibaci